MVIDGVVGEGGGGVKGIRSEPLNSLEIVKKNFFLIRFSGCFSKPLTSLLVLLHYALCLSNLGCCCCFFLFFFK